MEDSTVGERWAQPRPAARPSYEHTLSEVACGAP